jgi:hypothetical protein
VNPDPAERLARPAVHDQSVGSVGVGEQ